MALAEPPSSVTLKVKGHGVQTEQDFLIIHDKCNYTGEAFPSHVYRLNPVTHVKLAKTSDANGVGSSRVDSAFGGLCRNDI